VLSSPLPLEGRGIACEFFVRYCDLGRNRF
jgi:hypothetical protein